MEKKKFKSNEKMRKKKIVEIKRKNKEEKVPETCNM